jgi:hypothetical protein
MGTRSCRLWASSTRRTESLWTLGRPWVHLAFYSIYMRHLCIQSALLGACTVLGLFAQSPPAKGPSEKVVAFLPSDGEVLTKGTTVMVSAVVDLAPSSTETVKYVGNILINGRRRRYDGPFVNVLTRLGSDSSESVRETQSWSVHVRGPMTMRVRLKLEGTGESSGAHLQFADLTRTYSVKCNSKTFVLWRVVERFFGCCG